MAVDSGEMDEEALEKLKREQKKKKKGQNQEGEKEGNNTGGVGVR